MLWQRFNYTSPLQYLSNIFIYELDIQKANISVLYWKGIINKETYNMLWNAERMYRQIYIGNLQKDIKITKILQQGIFEAKRVLFEANNIQDHEVLAIKNDAVFIIGRLPERREFGLIKFIPKNVYTGFYKICNLEMYYLYNNITQEEKLDIKGISEDKLELHKPYFYSFLKDLLNIIQINGVETALQVLKSFYMQYINRELDVNYYRQFNSNGEFHFSFNTFNKTGFEISTSNNTDKRLLDISTNLKILVEMQKILVNMFFHNINK